MSKLVWVVLAVFHRALLPANNLQARQGKHQKVEGMGEGEEKEEGREGRGEKGGQTEEDEKTRMRTKRMRRRWGRRRRRKSRIIGGG
eukprot:5385552-Pyramimonas_sp.AAC.1